MRRPPRRQQGVAVITALLIVALATVLVAAAMSDFDLDLRRTEATLFSEQAQMYALGAEAWSVRILSEDAEDNNVDHPGEVWATDLPPLPIDGGAVDGGISDLQGRFNLNNLVDANGDTDTAVVAQFQRLLELLDLDRRWAGLAADWIDTNIEPTFPDGAEDSAYLGQTPGYRTPNMPVVSASELMSLPEMDEETFRTLEPFVTALPRGTPINVNTASAPVLASVSQDLSLGDATSIIEDRPEEGYETLTELEEALPADRAAPLAVSSRYFRLAVRVNIGSVDFTMYSLLERQGAGSIRTLLRSYGTD